VFKGVLEDIGRGYIGIPDIKLHALIRRHLSGIYCNFAENSE
jgi:hypothetical protein